MSDLNEKEQIMREYWLGALSRERAESLETDWFAGDEDAELLEIARADLIDDYLAKNLSEREISHFEKNFLPDNLADVVLAKFSLEISREESAGQEESHFLERFFGKFRFLFGVPQIAAVAVLLLVCFGLWLMFSGDGRTNQVARHTEPPISQPHEPRTDSENPVNPAPTGTLERPNDGDSFPDANVRTNQSSAESPTESLNRNPVENKKPPAGSRAPVERRQVVFLTILRGGGEQSIRFENGKDLLTLKLTMPGIDQAYKKYQLKIYDAAGKVVVQRDVGVDLSLKKSGETLTMPALPVRLFKKNNTYRTALAGVDENGAEIELMRYDGFRVE